MAQAKTIKFGQAYLLIRENDSAGQFIAPCGFESLTMTVNTETNTTNVPDCDNPDLAAWLESDVVSQQMTLEGEGVLDTDAMQAWHDWWFIDGAGERDIRFFKDITAPNGGGYYQGPAIITNYQETGERGNRWRISVSLAFNGKPTWTPAV